MSPDRFRKFEGNRRAVGAVELKQLVGVGLATYEDRADRTQPQSQARGSLVLLLVPFVRVGHNLPFTAPAGVGPAPPVCEGVKGVHKTYHCGGGIVYHRRDDRGPYGRWSGDRLGAREGSVGVG